MENFKKFLASTLGKVVVTLVSAVLIFGLLLLCTTFDSEYLALIIAVLCGYFGWKALSFITPNFFLIMPIGAWAIYYLVKGVLSVFVGVFVAPFQIGLMISRAVQDAVNE